MKNIHENKVLFLTEKYSTHNVPNSLCVEKIIHEWNMRYKNIDARVLSIENEHINEDFFSVLYNYQMNGIELQLRKIKKFFTMPIGHSKLVDELEKQLDLIKQEFDFDTIIAVINPVETAEASYRFKLRNPKVKFILYEIDPNSNRYKVPENFIEKQWKTKSTKWEKKVYSKADYIIHMESHKNHFERDEYKVFKDKTIYLDIPSFNVNISKKSQNNEVMKLLYAGAFYPKLREPYKMLRILSFLKNDFRLDIYTGKKMRSALNILAIENPFIVIHDSVSQDEINDITMTSDVLISLGNKNSDFLPSKTLVYMGTGKPIIHFYEDDDDTSIKYLRRYSNALLIRVNDNITENVKKISCFLKNLPDTITEPSNLIKEFYENTSEYSADRICLLLTGESE